MAVVTSMDMTIPMIIHMQDSILTDMIMITGMATAMVQAI